MFSVIVVPHQGAGPDEQLRLAPGETLRFGRGPMDAGNRGLIVAHPGVSRSAGRITATSMYWTLSNLSRTLTYVVENPEGAGEHIKVAPGRLDAPVPFEFSRLVMPAGTDLLGIDVWAPRHEYVEDGEVPSGGEPTAHAFPLDRGKRYFLVLVALCAPRLRGAAGSAAPTVDQLVDHLRPVWPEVTRAAVQWNIDYLAVKFRLKQPREAAAGGPRLNGKKESLISLSLRFDLVGEHELALLERTTAP
ncbi:FHA domain-containing protein [Streptomyces formicae]